MARQVLDCSPSAGITTNQSNEHQRRWSEKNWERAARNGNYDITRAHLNFEIAKGGIVQPIDTSKSIPNRMRETLRARGIADPNEEMKRKGKQPNRRTVVNIIFGGSRDRMHELAFGNQTVNLEHGADNSHINRCKDIEDWARIFTDSPATNGAKTTSLDSMSTSMRKIRIFTAPCCLLHSRISFHIRSCLQDLTRTLFVNGPFSFTMSWLWSTRNGDLDEDSAKP